MTSSSPLFDPLLPNGPTASSSPTAGATPQLDVRVDCVERYVHVSGELDAFSLDVLRGALCTLIAQRPGDVTLDCADLTFIDAASLGMLVHAAAQLTDVGAGLALVSVSARLRRTFQIAGLTHLLDPGVVEVADVLRIVSADPGGRHRQHGRSL